MRFLDSLPRFLLLTGKGGVGKTSLACAAAVVLARQGRRVLLVSTDPASNVGQVLGTAIGDRITAIPGVDGLSAIEIDPEEAASAYRERILAPVRGILPEREIAAITEQLSGSCTTEIASFNEFTSFLADPAATADYDHVVFDTAPTGHTIRLLELPGSWTDYLDRGKGDASCLGPMSGLEKHRAVYRAAVEALTDPSRTRLVLVSRAQAPALAEAARTCEELGRLGIRASHLVVNGALPDAVSEAPLYAAVREREHAALAAMPEMLRSLPADVIPLTAEAPMGADALERLIAATVPMPAGASPAARTASTDGAAPAVAGPLADLVDELAETGHGLIMTMGKGGVGKTTLAAAIAVGLAERGHSVRLTTTDPAAHVTGALAGSAPQGLDVDAIDPEEAIRAYRERVLATKGAHLDETAREALREDLMSPCTEEIAVFEQFSKAVREAGERFVVVDTAPTGHTLLLMDATGAYHRDMERQLTRAGLPAGITPLMRLQDPGWTRIVVTALPETTPVLEAEGLVADLERAGIEPWAWAVNQSLEAASPIDPLLAARARAQAPLIERVAAQAPRLAVIPLLAVEPRGAESLGALSRR